MRPTRAAARKRACRPKPACRPYLVLLPVGFTVPFQLPGTRCALTAPFHPCRWALWRAGGLLSVALSLGSPPPGVTRHRVSVEPGLSSPGAETPKAAIRPSGGAEHTGCGSMAKLKTVQKVCEIILPDCAWRWY